MATTMAPSRTAMLPRLEVTRLQSSSRMSRMGSASWNFWIRLRLSATTDSLLPSAATHSHRSFLNRVRNFDASDS